MNQHLLFCRSVAALICSPSPANIFLSRLRGGRPSLAIRGVLGFVGWAWLLTPAIAWQTPVSPAPAQLATADNEPVAELQHDLISTRLYYDTFVERGTRLIEHPANVSAAEWRERLQRAPARSNLPRPAVPPIASADRWERWKAASLIVGTIYDCGRCNQMHGNIAGGVVVSPDGLVLTNHHVLHRTEPGVKGLLAMTHQGECFSIAEIIAVNEAADVALIRLAVDRELTAVPLATQRPRTLDAVTVVSHPHDEFYVVTQGIVSRWAKPTLAHDATPWLEITAEFSGGSSGSGVFNQEGELVGLVSRIAPFFRVEDSGEPGAQPQPSDERRPPGRKNPYPEQILRRCVPTPALWDLFAETPAPSNLGTGGLGKNSP